MQNTPSGPEFIRLLRQAGVEADDRRLAEIVWLARLLTPEAEPPPAKLAPPGLKDEAGPWQEAKPESPAAAWGPIEIVTRSYREQRANEVFLNTAADAEGGIRVSRRRVAGVPALPDAEALGRALRPFQRRVRGPGPGPLDEVATVELAAESGLILPVRGPKRERWFDAAVVFEDRPAMVVWRETIREFRRLLERHGAFRDAQLWRIEFPDDDAEPRLLSFSGAARDLHALHDPSGRRLVFLFSDGVSAVWRDGRMRQAVAQWGARMPVVLVQVLSEAQWFRTAHGDPASRVRTARAGSPNERLEPEAAEAGGPRLPVVMPYPRSLGRWAAMLMNGGEAVPALELPAGPASPASVERAAARSNGEIEAEARLRSLTDPARKLVRYLSAVPLQTPVMRLIQRAMLPDSRVEHLAEIMLSGLIKRANPDRDVATLAEDEIDFDFIRDDLRDSLQRELRFGELDFVLRCVSDYVSDRTGSRCDLRALIADSQGPITVSREAFPFARIAARALALHGIRPAAGYGEIVEGRGTGWVRLSPFDFTTVSLDERGKQTRSPSFYARQFIENLGDGVALEMVETPGGEFLMGTSPKDADAARKEAKRQGASPDWIDAELPQHPVNVSPFYIGKFTITQAQWRAVAEWPKVERDLKPDPSRFKGDDRPVETVSWEDAQEFCARLRAKTGRAYRLPTEAEWEYACRAGTTTPFAFGETITPEIVNYDGNYPYAKAKKGEFRNETISVGSLGEANAFGLFDMHGNVWEWCEDVWHKNYEGAPTDGSAWLSGGDSSFRLLRGGSWLHLSIHCRSAYRDLNTPDLRVNDIGVRVVVARVS